MVSSKVIVLAIVLVVCIIQAQGAPRVERGLIDWASSESSSSGGDNIYNNFSQYFTKFTKNPSDIIIVMTNYFKKGESVS